MADSATPSTPKMKPRIPTLTERELEYPAMPAEADGLPDGWVIRRVPRPDGGGNERIHNIFCSPSGFKFGSRAEARRFVDRVEGTGGDEAEVARTDSMRPRCAHPSCPNLALARGLCRKHRPRCAVEGCDYIVYARGRCRKCNGRGDGGGGAGGVAAGDGVADPSESRGAAAGAVVSVAVEAVVVVVAATAAPAARRRLYRRHDPSKICKFCCYQLALQGRCRSVAAPLIAIVVDGDAANNCIVGRRMATLHVLYFIYNIHRWASFAKPRPVCVGEASDGHNN